MGTGPLPWPWPWPWPWPLACACTADGGAVGGAAAAAAKIDAAANGGNGFGSDPPNGERPFRPPIAAAPAAAAEPAAGDEPAARLRAEEPNTNDPLRPALLPAEGYSPLGMPLGSAACGWAGPSPSASPNAAAVPALVLRGGNDMESGPFPGLSKAEEPGRLRPSAAVGPFSDADEGAPAGDVVDVDDDSGSASTGPIPPGRLKGTTRCTPTTTSETSESDDGGKTRTCAPVV
jgi:hypothetical protein